MLGHRVDEQGEGGGESARLATTASQEDRWAYRASCISLRYTVRLGATGSIQAEKART